MGVEVFCLGSCCGVGWLGILFDCRVLVNDILVHGVLVNGFLVSGKITVVFVGRDWAGYSARIVGCWEMVCEKIEEYAQK